MCIVPHIHNGHFADFMNHLSVVAFIENGRYSEYGIHHSNKFIFPAHQVNKSLRIVKYRPSVVPTVAFRKGVTPFQRRERRLECTVRIASAHQFRLLVEKILVVHGTFCEEVNLFLRAFKFFCQFINAPVIVSVFQSAGSVLIDFYVIRNITQFVVVFMS